MDEILQMLSLPGTYVALLSIVLMLVVLDIDNVVFMTIVALKLPPDQQKRSISLGLLVGLGIRVVMLLLVGYLAALETPLFSIDLGTYQNDFTWKTLITLGGGLFLLAKATMEMHNKLEGPDPDESAVQKAKSFAAVLAQISVLNLIFSVDSVITAVGMTPHTWLMCVAMAISFVLILIFAHPIARFVQKHPSLKLLGLAFLLLIGAMLVTEALHVEIPKGYIYFAMAFSLGVEFLNIQVRKKGIPVKLHTYQVEDMEQDRAGHSHLRSRYGDDPTQ